MRTPFLAALLSLAGTLAAQTPSEDSLRVDLEDVVIVENRLELPFPALSRSIHLLRSADLKHIPAISAAEMLQYVPGVDIRQRGVHGVQADVSIRGGTFDQSLVLLNGIRLNDPQTGHHQLNLPLDHRQIERIEVLKGPAARIYGQNAFTGAINIVTRQPDRATLDVAIRAGQHQLGGIMAAASLPGRTMNHQMSIGRDFSQGYRHNTDYSITNAFYQGQGELGGGTFRVLAGFSERRFGANGFYASPAFTEQYEEVQTSLVALDYSVHRGRWTLKPRVYWRRNQDEYIFNRRNPAAYRNLHIGNSLGLEFHAQHRNRWGLSGVGGELSRFTLASNNLGARERNILTAFLEHRFSWLGDRLDITPGLSFSAFSDYEARLFPGVDAGLALSRRWKVYANAGQTFRVPTFTDLYYQDPANAGNPELRPESAFAWEAGFKYIHQGLHIQAAWFDRDGRDLIDWTRSATDQPWRPDNVQNLTMRGVDASLDYHLQRGPLRMIRLGYTLIEADVRQTEGVLSRYVLNHLRHQAMAGLELGAGPFALNLQGRYQERIQLEDYLLVDARLAYTRGAGQYFLEATNLTSANYTGPNLVPMPGRWIRGGIRMRLVGHEAGR